MIMTSVSAGLGEILLGTAQGQTGNKKKQIETILFRNFAV